MDVKLMLDTLAQNARPLAAALVLFLAVSALLKSSLAKRLWKGIEDTIFSSWQLALLGTTGLVLSAASGYTTWDGMRNFTGEPVLSGMITFGIQGVMLIVAWLIGESFATGMNMQSQRSQSTLVNPAVQNWLGAAIGLLLFVSGIALFLQWTGSADVRQASGESISWSKAGDKMLIFAFGVLMVALFTLYAASDLIRPYIQGVRVLVRNSMLWVMFLACMATSVFFSFDSLFTSIFPQSERIRAAELRAQNQVAGVIADIETTISERTGSEANALFQSDPWTEYEGRMNALAKLAQASEGAIERYVNAQIEDRRRAVKEQQERMASAQSGQAGLANRKTSLTDEKSRLTSQRPELAAEYAAKKAEYDAKAKEVDAKRVEAMGEDKGVEGTGKEGKGPVWRQRMSELNLLQNAVKIAEERMRDAQKRVTAIEARLTAIDRELAMIDGDLAKLKGEAETAEQRIRIAEDTVKNDDGPQLDAARLVPAFERSIADFREKPSTEKLADVHRLCTDIYGALAATPETKGQLTGLDCDQKRATDAAAGLFNLQAGTKLFAATCSGGDKLVANQGADALFAFARRCLADSALPSADTDGLRTKINHIELARDDKAHRFVVTWNAFTDGNRLAYLALAIAIAIDGLIFMSGLFGANAVRSPLSDVPTYKARSASQLEATINAALGPHPHETAWLTLNALRPMTYQDGFSAIADLSVLDKPTADRVRMVLTAGADIGAVETASHDPERYRVRSELREYLSSVCDRHYKTDAGAKEKARLHQLVGAALEPFQREHADLVLHALEPIREIEGFTSKVQLNEITDAYEARVVRRVMNAGATVKAVAPDLKVDDLFYVSPLLYETLLTIRATSPESAGYEYERRRYGGVINAPAIDGGRLSEAQTPLPQAPVQQALPKAEPKLPPPLTPDEIKQWGAYYRDQMLASIRLDSLALDQRLAAPGLREAMLDAWRALKIHCKKNDILERLLTSFVKEQEAALAQTYQGLKAQDADDQRKINVLDAVDNRIQNELPYFLLLPDMQLIDNLINEMEQAAQHDDGLRPDEESLRERLKVVQRALGRLDLADPQSWAQIKQNLLAGTDPSLPIMFKSSRQARGEGFGPN